MLEALDRGLRCFLPGPKERLLVFENLVVAEKGSSHEGALADNSKGGALTSDTHIASAVVLEDRKNAFFHSTGNTVDCKC